MKPPALPVVMTRIAVGLGPGRRAGREDAVDLEGAVGGDADPGLGLERDLDRDALSRASSTAGTGRGPRGHVAAGGAGSGRAGVWASGLWPAGGRELGSRDERVDGDGCATVSILSSGARGRRFDHSVTSTAMAARTARLRQAQEKRRLRAAAESLGRGASSMTSSGSGASTAGGGGAVARTEGRARPRGPGGRGSRERPTAREALALGFGLPEEPGRLVLGQDLVRIEADGPGVGADDALDEESARHEVEAVVLQGLQVAGDDLGGRGDLLDGDVARSRALP